MTETRQVQVPHSYFQKAKNEYSDWRWAVIREFIQNAYDAQAANIDFRLLANAAGRVELHVDDDGVGMDQDTLENVLLCLGGTRKLEGAIGGKGWAKAILFFAHHGYTICSRYLRVEGTGGEYRLTTQSGRIPGTQITVELSDEAALLDCWCERIKNYVAACFMEYATGRPVTIRLDGQALPQNNDGSYSFALSTALGDVWYDEVPDSNRSAFIVSVSGLPMFIETFYSSANQSALRGGIELNSGSAVLTANRDGFTSAVRAQFSEVVANLVENRSVARFGQALDVSINFAAGSRLTPPIRHSSTAGSEPSGRSCVPLLTACPEPGEQEVSANYATALGRIRYERYPANFHLKVESLSMRRTAASRAFITAPALVTAMNKRRSFNLAHSWRAALLTILCCDWALANGVDYYDEQGQSIEDWDSVDGNITALQAFFRGGRVDAGFCFVANTEGLCSVAADGNQPHRIYINPLLLTSESQFRLGDTLDLAYHEVSHLWEQHHGEAFCGVEANLRRSVRRWMSEKGVLAQLACAPPL